LEISSLYARLWRNIASRRRKQLFLLVIVMVLTSFAEVASIGAVLPFLGILMAPEVIFQHSLAQPVVLMLGVTEPAQLLRPLTIVFILLALLSATMRVILLWAQTHLGFAIGADFGIEIYKKTLYQPYAVHVMRNSSEVIAGISIKVHSVVGAALLPILTIMSSGMILIAILLALVAIDPLVAMAALAGIGLPYGLIMFATKKRLKYNGELINLASNDVIKALQEGLGGIRDVLIDGSQKAYCKVYRDADLSLRRSQASIQIIGGSPRFIIEFLGLALIAIVAYALSGRDGGIATATPILGVLVAGAQRLLPVLQQLYSSWTAMRGGRASLQDVLDLLDQPLPVYADAPLPAPMPYSRSIELSEISFRYSSNTPWVVQEVDLVLPKGGRIGLIGATGSGKSTLLDLIMGLLKPTKGTLAVDGVLLTEDNYRSWQAHIAHVPQAIFLSDATIAENIAFGVEPNKIDIARVRRAASQAQIATTIESWTDKYETSVGERGVRLSGGQRQRIGIARALYKQANVIVFDEATSALDSDTEMAVMEAIDYIDKDITILIVAHRLTTLKSCDRIVELANGRIIRSGSYDEMIHAERRQ
jgi:ABC-type multidrug transport system fused ATPase/permease subunit